MTSGEQRPKSLVIDFDRESTLTTTTITLTTTTITLTETQTTITFGLPNIFVSTLVMKTIPKTLPKT